eukprot:766428-Hanusia_phi.AAC.16
MHTEQKKHVVHKAGDTFLSSPPFGLPKQGGGLKSELGYCYCEAVKEIKQGGGLEISVYMTCSGASFFLRQPWRRADDTISVPESLTVRKAKYRQKLLDFVRASRLDRLEATGKASANAATPDPCQCGCGGLDVRVGPAGGAANGRGDLEERHLPPHRPAGLGRRTCLGLI